MIPHTHENKQKSNRVLRFAPSSEKIRKGKTKDVSNSAEIPSVEEEAKVSGLSNRTLDAFQGDADPANSLAEIRKLLIGPVSRLHEAQTEEIIAILDEAEKSNRSSFQQVHDLYQTMKTTCENLDAANVETNTHLQRHAELNLENMQRVVKSQNEAMTEMASFFESQLQKLADDLSQRLDVLATKTSRDYQALVSDLSSRVDNLEAAAKANDDRIVATFEKQLAQHEVNAEHQREKSLAVLREGFHDFAERITIARTPDKV